MTLSAASATDPIASATTLAARRTAATSAGFPATPVEFPAEFAVEFADEFPAVARRARVAPAHADAVTSARTPTSHTAWNADGTAPFDAARITVAARWSSSPARPSPAAESPVSAAPPTSASAAAAHAFAVASANAAILAIAASSSSGVA